MFLSSLRTLAIDWGEKRIGLAMSDEGGRFATALEVIDAASAVDTIRSLIKKEDVARVLIGLPIDMDGSIGPSAQRVITWGRSLTTTPLIFVDERLSSFDAEQQLIERKRSGERMTRKQKKSKLDAVVAAQLLQAFLDDRLPSLDIPT
ncbi:MAG: Holliday junction resolvase RuvX [Phycisphaerae bacterium]|nr:Holliday junction resolvase RuvX [Phycisphaerae bacterium]